MVVVVVVHSEGQTGVHESNIPHLVETVQMCTSVCFKQRDYYSSMSRKRRNWGDLAFFGQLHSVLDSSGFGRSPEQVFVLLWAQLCFVQSVAWLKLMNKWLHLSQHFIQDLFTLACFLLNLRAKRLCLHFLKWGVPDKPVNRSIFIVVYVRVDRFDVTHFSLSQGWLSKELTRSPSTSSPSWWTAVHLLLHHITHIPCPWFAREALSFQPSPWLTLYYPAPHWLALLRHHSLTPGCLSLLGATGKHKVLVPLCFMQTTTSNWWKNCRQVQDVPKVGLDEILKAK